MLIGPPGQDVSWDEIQRSTQSPAYVPQSGDYGVAGVPRAFRTPSRMGSLRINVSFAVGSAPRLSDRFQILNSEGARFAVSLTQGMKKKTRILAVDDEPLISESIAAML